MKSAIAALLSVGILLLAFTGGWWAARWQGAAALQVARDTIAVQQAELQAQATRAVAFAGEVDGLADSVQALLRRVRAIAIPGAATANRGVAPRTPSPARRPESVTDSGPPILAPLPPLVVATLEACDTLATRCQALADTVRALTDSITAKDARFTGILDSLAGTAPVPGLSIDLGGFKTGAVVGAGTVGLLVLLIALIH